MKKYQKILVAVDLSDESSIVAEKARAIALAFTCELHIIHVTEPVYYDYFESVIPDYPYIQSKVYDAAKESLAEFSESYHIAEKFRHLESGKPAKKIHELAKSIDADLIVIGTHGQHGISLLLGATAYSVLHGCSCDVLAVAL